MQLSEITGFDAVSLQPNSGASGEYAGLMAIRAYHHSRGDQHRNVCIIPTSAHGTNPASAIMAGMTIVTVSTDAQGNIDIAEMRKKATLHADKCAPLAISESQFGRHPLPMSVTGTAPPLCLRNQLDKVKCSIVCCTREDSLLYSSAVPRV